MSVSLYASVGRTARQLINKFGKRMDRSTTLRPCVMSLRSRTPRSRAYGRTPKSKKTRSCPYSLGTASSSPQPPAFPCPPSPTRSSWTAKHGASWTPHPWPREMLYWSTTS
nr:MAG TPA: hypothetical protein [Caudoviricetes sp.]